MLKVLSIIASQFVNAIVATLTKTVTHIDNNIGLTM